VKLERLHRLQALLGDQQREIQASMVGRTVKVLFEKKGRESGQMIGKSEYLHAVFADTSDVTIGDLRDVKIVKSESNSLGGEIC
jgi:tRNA-2-methylthio-N6-dimethylallyladenosine synthase